MGGTAATERGAIRTAKRASGPQPATTLIHCDLSQQRFHFCFETLHSRLLFRWAALLKGIISHPLSSDDGICKKVWPIIWPWTLD